jgi:hypothetical protein
MPSADASRPLLAAAHRTPLTSAGISHLAVHLPSDPASIWLLVDQAIDAKDGPAACALTLAAATHSHRPSAELVARVLPFARGAVAGVLIGAAAGDRVALLMDTAERAPLERSGLALALLVVCYDLRERNVREVDGRLMASLRSLARAELAPPADAAMGLIGAALRDPELKKLTARLTEAVERQPKHVEGLGRYVALCLVRPGAAALAAWEDAERRQHPTVRRAGPKVGRNDTCPCGSGRKAKQCCGAGGEAAGRTEAPATEVPPTAAAPPRNVDTLPAAELAAIDPATLPLGPMRLAIRRLGMFREWAAAERFLADVERRPGVSATQIDDHRHSLVTMALLFGAPEVAARHIPKLTEPPWLRAVCETHIQLLDPAARLAPLDAQVGEALRADDPDQLYCLCHVLLHAAPALGVLVTRGCLDPAHARLADGLLAGIDQARDRLLLPAGDERRRYEALARVTEASGELPTPDEIKRIRRGLDRARARIEELEATLRERDAGALSPSVPLSGAAAPPLEDEERRRLRGKIDELRALLADSRAERTALRDEVAALREELADQRAEREAIEEALASSSPALDEGPPGAVDADVLAVTRGKRVLVIGGQGARDAHARAMAEKLELGALEWLTSERNQSSPFARLRERIRPGAFDLVLYLTGYTSHRANRAVADCKAAGLPVVYLPRGYSLAQVVQGIREQIVRRVG